MYPAVKSFARENPTMILTLCYVLITAIGTAYSFFFYREFDINIIKFADLSDFLLAAILEPRSLIMFAFTVVMMSVAYWFDTLLRNRFNFYQNFVQNRLKAKYTDPVIMLVIVLLLTFILVRDLAVQNADSIKDKSRDSFQVLFSENESGESTKNLELLGSTSRFVYFYNHTNKKSVVISPENVSFMSKPVVQDKPSKQNDLIPNQSTVSPKSKKPDQ